nr:AAA family ATPase [Actinomycetota bacterium]
MGQDIGTPLHVALEPHDHGETSTMVGAAIHNGRVVGRIGRAGDLEVVSETSEQGLPSDFVGRREEVASLQSGVDAALEGRSSFFLITGEAGIGKSRLVEVAMTYAKALDVRVVSARCWEAVDSPSYWPWIQVLRELIAELDDSQLRSLDVDSKEIVRLVPQLGKRLGFDQLPSADAVGDRFLLFDSIASLIRAAAARLPLMVVLEDLHAADESSLLLLQFLVGQDRNRGLMVVGTYDDVVGGEKAHHEQTLSETIRQGHHLALRGLDYDAVKQLYEGSAGMDPSDEMTRAVYDASEGNPFFVKETVRMLTRKGELFRPDYSIGFRVPEGARGVIRQRIAAVDEGVAELLSVASVLGREFDLTLLQKVTEIDVDPLLEILTQACAADLVRETSALGRYAFSHILIRETLYEDLKAAKRMRLHRTVAETLEEPFAASQDSNRFELAHHWFKAAQAGDPVMAMNHAIDAADHAMSQHAYEEAVRLYQRALKVSGAAGASVEILERIRRGLAMAQSPLNHSDPVTAGHPASSGTFICEGDFWTIGYSGLEIRLKDSKGVQYIAELLKLPGQEVHVLSLVGLVEGHDLHVDVPGAQEDLGSWGLGDAGVVLDAAAKTAYKNRLEDLREELEEAQGFNDPERAARAQG